MTSRRTKTEGWQLPDPMFARQRPPAIGAKRRTAYALALLGLEVVSRSTLRAMLPVGVERRRTVVRDARRDDWRGKNKVTEKFKEALQIFEVSGWIQRGEKYVLVRDRRALLEFALYELDEQQLPKALLDIESAVTAVQASLTDQTLTPKAIEQARAELAALRRLMVAPVLGRNRSGRGSVRRVGPAGSGE